MNAKWHIINHLACAVVFLSVCSFSAFSQERDTIFIIEHDTVWMDLQPDAGIESQTRENRYDRRVHRYRRHWEALIPTHTKIQFAGNMGLLSFGTGWDYGRRNQWETDVFFGVLFHEYIIVSLTFNGRKDTKESWNREAMVCYLVLSLGNAAENVSFSP